ncbi:DOCK family protein [Cavenderia fasciculata]|uniref:DOCK family protein n=1 Tax=Cavenderia fasciculata TaxID=261658 RepID=F4PHN6_CACFS|nr:DOCK family protein [Cavenderia fasciculata]EGG25220.1 DOCK family protein [Cavenderia fasciculata]|eukprot:XP_004363071.1 DOCK family protein [Cavenderia fasciculata]
MIIDGWIVMIRVVVGVRVSYLVSINRMIGLIHTSIYYYIYIFIFILSSTMMDITYDSPTETATTPPTVAAADGATIITTNNDTDNNQNTTPIPILTETTIVVDQSTSTATAGAISPLKRMVEIPNNTKSTENLLQAAASAAASDSTAQPPPQILTPLSDTSSDTAMDNGGGGGLTPRLSNPQLIHTSSLGMLPSRMSGVNAGAADRHLHRYRHYVEAKLVGNSVKMDPLAKHLINYPVDDISIKETVQSHRTKESTVPINTDNTSSGSTTPSNIHQHIKMSLESFAAPRKTVIKNYSKFKKEAERLTHFDNDKYDVDIDRTPPNSPMIDLNLNSSNHNEQPADEIQNDLLKTYQDKDTDTENTANRKKGRVGFFRYFRPDYNWGSGTEVSICNRTPQDIWSKQNYVNVLIELKGLVFMLGDLEPFFCTLYLYDSVNKCRISENFHFDFNSDQLRSLLDKHNEKADITTQSKHLIVSLPVKQMNDIWVMVRINKVMQGDPDLVKEPYVKIEEKDVKVIKKNKAKVSDVVTKFCERLGKYTQPFSFSAIPLTGENGDVKNGAFESDSLFKQVPKDNDDIDELIADLKDATRKKKLKTIPGTFSYNISKGTALPPHTTRLDPSFDTVINVEPLNSNISSNNNRFSAGPGIVTSSSSSLTPPVLLVNATSAPNLASLVPPPISVTPTTTGISLTVPSTLSATPSISVSSLASATTTTPSVTSPSLLNTSISSPSPSLSRTSTLNAIVPVIRELQCFPLKEDLIPHSAYINNLYIYPDTVNLSKASGRNICIKVEIRDSDSVSQPPLSVIYGKSSNQKFTNQFYTDTHYHTKTPSFNDEIKVKLPTQLTTKYHILFSYYHIVCNKKKEKEESEQLVGYSFLPLYGQSEKKLVDNGLHNLPVVLGIPKDGYLKKDDLDYLENGKNLFKLNLRLNSSIYPQNSYLNRFFLNSLDEKLSDSDLNQILNDFIHIDAYESIKFFPVIIRQLIYVMCNRDATVGCNAIKAIFILLSKIQNYFEDSNVRIPFLVSFISHVFDCPTDTKIPVYSALCSRFVYFLMLKKYQSNQSAKESQKENNSPHSSSSGINNSSGSGSGSNNGASGNSTSPDISNSTLFSFSWFIFDLIIKSITLSSLDTIKGSRENKYDQDFIKYVPKLISFIIHHFQGAVLSSTDGRLALEANNSLALFVRDLFSVFDRGITVDLVFGYTSEMKQGTSSSANESFIVTDYEHYININIPLPYAVTNIQTIKQKIIDMHPVAGLLITEVMEAVTSTQSEVRGVALNTLLALLIKHEYDGRYQSADKRERIASIYLPIILWFLDNFELFTNWYFVSGTEEKRLLISKVPQRINTLFTMIDYCTNPFEYRPAKSLANSLPHMPSIGNVPPALHAAVTSAMNSSAEVDNIGRVKIQSTIALSKLASDNYAFGKVGARNLERALATLVLYSRSEEAGAVADTIIDRQKRAGLSAEQVTEAVDKFGQQIQNMSTKLVKIIRDTMRVNQLKENSDPETIHELYSKIADGYSDTPIIRVDWLDALATLHVSQENYVEAAICKIRIAMLIHAYLDQHNLLPCRLDTSLIKNIVPELHEVVVEEDEGVCTSPLFSIPGLISSVILAINQFRMGEFYEFAILLYKLIIPLSEKTREYDKLSSYYKQSHKLYKEIIKTNDNKSRMLGRYYRVGFYGRKFEDLDGKEFVYKEPKLTHLFSLAERLKTFYREKLGETINIFPDSGRIVPSNLDQEKLYLQITSLKPYFDSKSDEEPRIAYIDRKTLLTKFVFITPFTLSGKIQGSITEQFHRKSIISIDCTAPNMLKRYPIVKYKEIEISPIENSIETIEQRSKLLSLEIHTEPVNIKTLQGVLQGSVLLQVNAGALEICRGFLSKNSRVNWNNLYVQKLEEKCREFLVLCRKALDLNKCNIQMNQISFHHELEQGYRRLQFKMEKYINGEINESEEAELDQILQDDADDDSSQLTITEDMYDNEKDSSLFDGLTPSSLIPNFIKDPKKKSGFLTVKDTKPKRESKELNVSSILASGDNSIFNNNGKNLETPRSSSSKRDSKGEP